MWDNNYVGHRKSDSIETRCNWGLPKFQEILHQLLMPHGMRQDKLPTSLPIRAFRLTHTSSVQRKKESFINGKPRMWGCLINNLMSLLSACQKWNMMICQPLKVATHPPKTVQKDQVFQNYQSLRTIHASISWVTSSWVQLLVSKYEQGCPTKDRPLSTKDGRLSVWHACQMTWSCLGVNQPTKGQWPYLSSL